MLASLEHWVKRLNEHPRIVLGIVALLLAVQINGYWIPVSDGPSYLSIARNIGTGNGLLRFGGPHLFHPIGYPLAISPAFMSSERPFLLIAMMHWVFLIVFMICTYKWMQSAVGDDAILMTLLTISSVGVLYCFRRTLSEVAFMPVMVGAALALNRAAQSQRNRILYLVLGTILTCYLCLIRQVGISIVAGFAVLLVIKVHTKSIGIKPAIVLVLVLAVSAVACTAIEIAHGQRTAQMSEAATFTGHILKSSGSLWPQLLGGLRLRIQECGRLLIPGMFKVYGGWLCPAMLLYLPLCAVLVVGWWTLLVKKADVLLCALPFYLLVYIVLWPYDQGTRFMTPMVGVLWAGVWTFVEHCRFRAHARKLFAVLLLLGGLTSACYLAVDVARAKRWDSQWATVEQITAAIDNPKGDIACYGLSSSIRAMLDLSMDKSLRTFSVEKGKTTEADYVITSSGVDTIWGFKPIADIRGFMVHQRLSGTNAQDE